MSFLIASVSPSAKEGQSWRLCVLQRRSACVCLQKCFCAFLLLSLCLRQPQPCGTFGQSAPGGTIGPICLQIAVTARTVLASASACWRSACNRPWHKEPHRGTGSECQCRECKPSSLLPPLTVQKTPWASGHRTPGLHPWRGPMHAA